MYPLNFCKKLNYYYLCLYVQCLVAEVPKLGPADQILPYKLIQPARGDYRINLQIFTIQNINAIQ